MAPGRISDVLNTKHNFSPSYAPDLPSSATRTVTGTSSEACVYCHTPHGDPKREDPVLSPGRGDAAFPAQAFLWNHKDSAVPSYTMYNSSSMDATVAAGTQVGPASKMCLSCHDGTVAVGSVEIAMIVGTGVLLNPNIGSATITDTTTGKNSNIGGVGGSDLSNDHPISFQYSDAVAAADGELVSPSNSGGDIGVRVGRGVLNYNTENSLTDPKAPVAVGTRKAVPLEKQHTFDGTTVATIDVTQGGTVECTTCHDPHIRSVDNSENIKFLRLHRFQKGVVGQDVGSNFEISTDINCLACHRKAGWSQSVHATSEVAYSSTGTATSDREFPDNVRVWEASCLNCHDAHTVSGGRYLLRESISGGDSSALKTYSGAENSAIEETCYQCHDGTSNVIQTAQGNIKTLMNFTGHDSVDLPSETHAIQKTGVTVDDAGSLTHKVVASGNSVETQTQLQTNRHAECSDCHNPHRMVKKQSYTGISSVNKGTHEHALIDSAMHTNTAPGVLRGVSGIEPVSYAAETWGTVAGDYVVLQGDPSDSTLEETAPGAYTGAMHVTKEYQVCLKCHSGYANGVGKTDQAMEFQPVNDAAGSGVNNNRSWHPVMDATNRGLADAMNTPFDAATGTGNQTMLCSDCHSNDNPAGPVGPHGASGNSKVLMATGDSLCLSCHKDSVYGDVAGTTFTSPGTLVTSGFSCTGGGCVSVTSPRSFTNVTASVSEYEKNLHVYHYKSPFITPACTDCHTAQSHGWKNKAFLVSADQEGAPPLPYTAAPYYSSAKINIDDTANSGNKFPASNAWQSSSCGTAGGCHL